MFVLYISEETDLKVPLHKEAWLIRFLRPCKFYPESALKLVKYRMIYLIVFQQVIEFIY